MKWVLAAFIVAAVGVAILFLGYYQGRQAYMAGYESGYLAGYVNAGKGDCGKR